MSLKLLSGPTAEPLLITDDVVKQALRVIDTAEDSLITMYLQMAREAAEKITRRALVMQQWVMALDKFPAPGAETSSANWYGPAWGTGPGPLTTSRVEGVTGSEIWVPRCPVQSIDSIQYVDATTGSLTTLSSSLYLTDLISEPARITPAVNTSWPSTLNVVNAVQVTFTAGYGSSGAAVPANIRNWILMMTATMFENREMVAILNRGKVEELPYVDNLLNNFRVFTFNPPIYWA